MIRSASGGVQLCIHLARYPCGLGIGRRRALPTLWIIRARLCGPIPLETGRRDRSISPRPLDATRRRTGPGCWTFDRRTADALDQGQLPVLGHRNGTIDGWLATGVAPWGWRLRSRRSATGRKRQLCSRWPRQAQRWSAESRVAARTPSENGNQYASVLPQAAVELGKRGRFSVSNRQSSRSGSPSLRVPKNWMIILPSAP